ncbi:hypothetical protein CDL12_09687 [Handroanthus impetiginosus]|uniref:Uncharacterized protein n=1 Tax=Handroanthus impetiginosus TaxID=429701 RepID=A0A2G9HJH7_9LAMI|nr:hypothetical protein CDL12_09687 [Handroanthus impetiginosus]
MAQLDQNLCGRKTEKERKKEGKQCLLMSSKLTKTHLTQHQKADNWLPQMPFCNPPKDPHLHHQLHCLSQQLCFYFCPNYVGFFALCLGQKFIFHRENRKAKKEPSHILLSPYFLSLFLSYLLSSISLFLYIQTPFLYCFSNSLLYSSLSPYIYLFSCFPFCFTARPNIFT